MHTNTCERKRIKLAKEHILARDKIKKANSLIYNTLPKTGDSTKMKLERIEDAGLMVLRLEKADIAWSRSSYNSRTQAIYIQTQREGV